jgi:hypothetical protein
MFYAVQAHSRVAQVAYRVSRRLRSAATPNAAAPSPFNQPGLPPGVYREPHNTAWQDAWRVTEKLLLAMQTECAARGIGFGVVTLSNPPQVYPDPAQRRAYATQLGVPDLLYPDRRIATVGERAGFPVLNLAPAFQAYADEHHVLLHGLPNIEPGMGHWNPQGHRLAATLIAPWLSALRASGSR